MLGFLIGTVCLIGLIKTLRHGSCGFSRGCYGSRGHRFGGGHGGPWGGFRDHGRWGGGRERGFGRGGFMLYSILDQLDATPAQERVIAAAVDELRESARAQRDELRRSRADVAKAVRSPAFDEELFGELFARHDSAIEGLRKAGMGAFAKVHEVLDERQRARLANLVEQGPHGWARGY